MAKYNRLQALNIKLLRTRKGWNQIEMAMRLPGFDRWIISDIETGRRDVSLYEGIMIANLFGVEPRELFDDSRL